MLQTSTEEGPERTVFNVGWLVVMVVGWLVGSTPSQILARGSVWTQTWHRRQGLHSQADPEKMHQAAKNAHFRHLTKVFAGFFQKGKQFISRLLI